MLNIRTLDQFAKACTLHPGITRKIERDRDAPRQESANVYRERVLQSRSTLDESRNVGDLTRKQRVQEIVLHKKDSIFSNRQTSSESGLACRHLPAEEYQLRGFVLAHLGRKVSQPSSKVLISRNQTSADPLIRTQFAIPSRFRCWNSATGRRRVMTA
jgi:hypothetical protein